MVMAPILQKTPWPSPVQWMGLLLGSTGVTLAIYRPGAEAGNPVLGGLLVIAATGSGAVAIILFSRIKSAKNATGISLSSGGLGLLLLGTPAFPQLLSIFDGTVLLATVWLDCVSAIAFAIWNHISTIFSVSLLASYRFLIPLCGVIEALIFERSGLPGWGLIVGALLVVGSMVIARRSGKMA